jgi:hypothetical protein
MKQKCEMERRNIKDLSKTEKLEWEKNVQELAEALSETLSHDPENEYTAQAMILLAARIAKTKGIPQTAFRKTARILWELA